MGIVRVRDCFFEWQDAYWKHCTEALSEEIKDKRGSGVLLDLRKCCKRCAESFLTLESVQRFLLASKTVFPHVPALLFRWCTVLL